MIKNATPHNINVIINGKTILFSKSDTIARVSVKRTIINEIEGIPVYSTEYGDIEGLPNETEGTYYIVSALVMQKAKEIGRKDLLKPGNLIRDENGNPIGCDGFDSNV